MNLLLIESPFIGKPLEEEIYDLTRTLFSSERLALRDGRGEEIDLHRAIARFKPRQLRVQIEGDNPICQGSFLHRGALQVHCKEEAVAVELARVIENEDSGLRRAFIAQEISFITVISPNGRKNWHFRPKPEERLKLRHGPTPTLPELAPLIDNTDFFDHDEILIFVNNPAHSVQIQQVLQRQRERLALLRNGFTQIQADDNIIIISRPLELPKPAPIAIPPASPTFTSTLSTSDTVEEDLQRVLERLQFKVLSKNFAQIVQLLRTALTGERLTVDGRDWGLKTLDGQATKPHQMLKLFRELHDQLGRRFEWTRDETSFYLYHFNADETTAPRHLPPPSAPQPRFSPSIFSLDKSRWVDHIYETVHAALSMNKEIKNDAEQYFSRAIRDGFLQLSQQPERIHRLDLEGFDVGKWGARPAVDDLSQLLNDIAQRLSSDDFQVEAKSKAAALFTLYSARHLDRRRLPKKLDEAQLGMMLTELATRLPRKGLTRFLQKFETVLRNVASGHVERDFLTFSDYLEDDDLRQTVVNQLNHAFSPYGIQLRRSGERLSIQQLEML